MTTVKTRLVTILKKNFNVKKKYTYTDSICNLCIHYSLVNNTIQERFDIENICKLQLHYKLSYNGLLHYIIKKEKYNESEMNQTRHLHFYLSNRLINHELIGRKIKSKIYDTYIMCIYIDCYKVHSL